MAVEPIRAGVATFTDPRTSTFSTEREKYNNTKHQELVRFLQERDFQVVDPLETMRQGWTKFFGLYSTRDVARYADELRGQDAECLIVGCWHWTDPQLVVQLIREK